MLIGIRCEFFWESCQNSNPGRCIKIKTKIIPSWNFHDFMMILRLKFFVWIMLKHASSGCVFSSIYFQSFMLMLLQQFFQWNKLAERDSRMPRIRTFVFWYCLIFSLSVFFPPAYNRLYKIVTKIQFTNVNSLFKFCVIFGTETINHTEMSTAIIVLLLYCINCAYRCSETKVNRYFEYFRTKLLEYWLTSWKNLTHKHNHT